MGIFPLVAACRRCARALVAGAPAADWTMVTWRTRCSAATAAIDLIGLHRLGWTYPRASILRIGADQGHDALRREIDQRQYDLLVMGGYSHAMWFEFMFGGVTQSLLLSSKIPILVSH